VPSIFTTFTQYDDEAQFGLRLLNRLKSDVRYSVFEAYTYAPGIAPPDKPPPNAVAKLVYGGYGTMVHQALYDQQETPNSPAVNQAPKLFGVSHKPGANACVYVMEYLRPPTFLNSGWFTLADETIKDQVAQNYDLIYPVLAKIVDTLMNLGFVHGDLHPTNLMIKMRNLATMQKPVEIMVVDFEWADRFGIACYPESRNEDVDYPGKPGELIGKGDDWDMINKWQSDMKEYRACINNPQ